jgi:hypothetical protein
VLSCPFYGVTPLFAELLAVWDAPQPVPEAAE